MNRFAWEGSETETVVSGNTPRSVLSRAVAIAIVLVSLAGCTSTEPAAEPGSWYPPTLGNGERVIAVYEGRVPRAGVGDLRTKVGLALYGNAFGDPASCLLVRVYVGEGNARDEVSGTWELLTGVHGYRRATVIRLDGRVTGEWRSYRQVNDPESRTDTRRPWRYRRNRFQGHAT